MSNKLELRPGVWAKDNDGDLWWIIGKTSEGIYLAHEEGVPEEPYRFKENDMEIKECVYLAEIIGPDLPEPLPEWPAWAAEEVVAIAEDIDGEQYAYDANPSHISSAWIESNATAATIFPSQHLTFPDHLPASERIIYRPES